MLKLQEELSGGLSGWVNDIATGGSFFSGSFSSGTARGIILKKLGLSQVIYSVSGAGALAGGTLQFFHGLGLNILNMYAQSESSALGTSWKNEDFEEFDLAEKAGSIGRALGNEVRVWEPDEDGNGELQ